MDRQRLQNSIWTIIILLVLGLFIYQFRPKPPVGVDQPNYDSQQNPQNPEQELSGPTQKTDKYNYEITLTADLSHFNAVEKSENDREIIEYFLDGKHLASVNVYAIDWWEQNTQRVGYSVYLKNQPVARESHLGEFLRKNSNQAFIWTLGADCLQNSCGLYSSIIKVMSSFRFSGEPTGQKIYQQEGIGFQITLPVDWKVAADIGEAVSFASTTDQTLGLSVAIVDGPVDEIRQRIKSNNETVLEHPTLFSGRPGVLILGRNALGGNSKQILIPWKGNKTFLMAGRDVEAVNNIMTSFKFD